MTTEPTETQSTDAPLSPEDARLEAVIAAGEALRGFPAEAGDVVLTAEYIITGNHPAILTSQILDGGTA